jgi:ABC-type nitrate/sulfonate/bicarbonate transport system substrate-binding protein
MKNKSSKQPKNIGLKVGGVPEHFNYPWRIAIEEGLFRKEGISLHWADMSGGTGQMIKGLQTGSLDVAVLLTEGATKSILQGLEAKILQIYVRSPLCWGIHVPYKSRFQDSKELENHSFAISREASGSHLMAYVLGNNHGWDLNSIQFNIVGDVYGGLWALENLEAQGFLWEKYTTQPFVDQKKCRRIGELVTPWPSFVIAARNEVIEKHPEALKKMLKIIQNRADLVKSFDNSPEIISWRYNLDLYQVKNWISETEWNNNNGDMEKTIEKVVSYLSNLDLLSDPETKDWETKLFI